MATAGKDTWIDQEKLVRHRQLVHNKEVGQSENQVAPGGVSDHMDSLDLAGEGVEDGEVAVDDVVEGCRELIFRSHSVLDDEDGVGGVQADSG